MFAEAVDPRRDTRHDADSIFNPAFGDVPDPVEQSARDHRRTVPINDVLALGTPHPRKEPDRGLARKLCRQAGPM